MCCFCYGITILWWHNYTTHRSEKCKRVKSSAQFLDTMHWWRLNTCQKWRSLMTKATSKCIDGGWTPVKNGVLWWPELPSAFVAFNCQKNDLSRNFLDHLQTIQKLSRQSGSFPGYLESFQVSGNFPGYPETFQAIQKLSTPSGKYLGYPKTFKTIQKTFWTIRKISRLSGNFPGYQETF